MLVVDFDQFCKVARCAHTRPLVELMTLGPLEAGAQPWALGVVGAKRRSHLYRAKSEKKKQWLMFIEFILCATQRLSSLSHSAFTSHVLPMKTPRPGGLTIRADSG